MKTSIIFSLGIVSIFICAGQVQDAQTNYVDPLKEILPEINYFNATEAHIDVARCNHSRFQCAGVAFVL